MCKFKLKDTVQITVDGYSFHNGKEGIIVELRDTKNPSYIIEIESVGLRQFFERELSLIIK